MKGNCLKNKLLPIFAMLLLVTNINAQKKYLLSADSAVALAFTNVVELKNSKLDSVLQWQKNKEITGMAYPQISGTVSTMHYYDIPVTVLPDFLSPAMYGTLVREGVKDGNGNAIQMPSSFGTFPASFGVPYTASAGFTVSQLLFQPDVFVGLKARSTSMQYVSNNVNVTKDGIKVNVYKSYYAVVIAEKRLKYLRENIELLKKLYSEQKAMYDNGFIEKLDLEKIEVAINNITTIEKQVDNGIQLGYAALKYALGLNQKDELILKDSLNADIIKQEVLGAEAFKYEDRNEIKLLGTVKRLQELDLQRNKLQYIPTISAYWNFSKNAQRQKFDFFNNGDWFTTNLVGLNINLPIWNGGQRESKIKQSRIALEKTNNSLDRVKQGIDLEKEAATISLSNSLKQLDIQDRNLALAEKVFSQTRKKYQQGVGSSFEILQSQQGLTDAQTNYFVSLYDAMIAKISLLKAIGKL